MKRLSLLCIIALLLTALQPTWGQTEELAKWGFTNPTGTWGTDPHLPIDSNSNVTVGGISRGPGVLATASSTSVTQSWGGHGLSIAGVTVGSQTAAMAVDSGNYFTMTLTAKPGYSISLDQIAPYNTRRTSTSGPASFLWQYSTDGTNFTDITTTLATGGVTTPAGTPQPAVVLNGIADLQNVPSTSTITLRVVVWGTAGPVLPFLFNGAGLNPNLTIMGTVISTPLPLELLSFKGKQAGGNNRLEWITAQEKNVAYFELERGTDGQHFTRIATIKATGNNSITGNQYSYVENNAGATAYYRLKMVDRDDHAYYSDVVVLHNDATSGSVRVYPNPAENTLFLDGLNSKATYYIADATGKAVIASRVTEGTAETIDVTGLPQGVYFLFYTDGTHNESIRFVKK